MQGTYLNSLIVCLYEMVENHQEEEDNANDVGEHCQLNVWDHDGDLSFSMTNRRWTYDLEQVRLKEIHDDVVTHMTEVCC